MQTKSNPQFIVIAGPNGAGKSTTSKKLLEPFGITAFDWDQRFHSKWSQFGFDPLVMEGVKETINSYFQDHIDLAFSGRSSVAYETNFHSALNLTLAQRAKAHGYNTSLYFLALKSPELGITRVAQRVTEGGHDVSQETIRERYQTGLEILDREAIMSYDRVLIYDSGDRFDLQLVIEKRMLVYQADHLEMDIMRMLPNIRLMLG